MIIGPPSPRWVARQLWAWLLGRCGRCMQRRATVDATYHGEVMARLCEPCASKAMLAGLVRDPKPGELD